jgi:hypothetical protein
VIEPINCRMATRKLSGNGTREERENRQGTWTINALRTGGIAPQESQGELSGNFTRTWWPGLALAAPRERSAMKV